MSVQTGAIAFVLWLMLFFLFSEVGGRLVAIYSLARCVVNVLSIHADVADDADDVDDVGDVGDADLAKTLLPTNVLANTLFCREQDIGRQKALGKAYCTQVLLTPDKLDPEITCRLSSKLASVLKTNSPKASVILTDGHVPFDLIDHILTANKQSLSLEDECDEPRHHTSCDQGPTVIATK
jgi:hypothetical protein